MAIKTGLGYIAAVEVQCPDCFEFVAGENGSHLLSSATTESMQAGQVVECFGCGLRFRLPALLAKATAWRAH